MTILYWFRNDLRLHDNPALQAAIQSGREIIPIYIFEEKLFQTNQLGFPRTSEIRWNYLYQSVGDFQNELKQLNGNLLIFNGNPTDIITQLYHQLNCLAVYAHHEYAHKEITVEQQLANRINLQLHWGNMLFAPNTIALLPDKSPFYYTAFKNKTALLKQQFPEVDTITRINFAHINVNNLPIQPISIETDTHTQRFITGETNAIKSLENYINSPNITTYQQTRELFEGTNSSTQLSPFLAIGSLSCNRLMNGLNSLNTDDPNTMASITKMKEQLIWRDYYRWLFLRYGNKIFRKTGLRTIVPQMYDDTECFDQWRLGQTDHPLVNALMKELSQTGWMSNRGRMLAAYYLSKELKVNWLWGAQWFESQLIDYDVCNNYGNWAYQSGTGTDSRINRRFNLDKQIQKYDPDHKFINRMLNP